MMIQYNRYAFTLLPNFYKPHEQPFLQSNIIKESLYEKKFEFFFQNFQWPSNPWQTLRKFYDANNCQFLKWIFKNLENQNLTLCVFVFNENLRFKAWTARKNYPVLRTPEKKSTKNQSEVQTCLKTTLILQAKIRLKSLVEIANFCM